MSQTRKGVKTTNQQALLIKLGNILLLRRVVEVCDPHLWSIDLCVTDGREGCLSSTTWINLRSLPDLTANQSNHICQIKSEQAILVLFVNNSQIKIRLRWLMIAKDVCGRQLWKMLSLCQIFSLQPWITEIISFYSWMTKPSILKVMRSMGNIAFDSWHP